MGVLGQAVVLVGAKPVLGKAGLPNRIGMNDNVGDEGHGVHQAMLHA